MVSVCRLRNDGGFYVTRPSRVLDQNHDGVLRARLDGSGRVDFERIVVSFVVADTHTIHVNSGVVVYSAER